MERKARFSQPIGAPKISSIMTSENIQLPDSSQIAYQNVLESRRQFGGAHHGLPVTTRRFPLPTPGERITAVWLIPDGADSRLDLQATALCMVGLRWDRRGILDQMAKIIRRVVQGGGHEITVR